MSTIKYYSNNKKRPRFNLDTWERQSASQEQEADYIG
jgi:hypothetical protein